MSLSHSLTDEEVYAGIKVRLKSEIKRFVYSKMFPKDPIDIATYGVFQIDRKNLIGDILVEISNEIKTLSAGDYDD